MRRAAALSITAGALALAPSAGAVPVSDLQHRCNNAKSPGAIGISYSGATGCGEANVLIGIATKDGKKPIRVGKRTVRLPHSTWKCTTIKRREDRGVIETRLRITCTVVGEVTPAKVRWFDY